MRQLRRAIQVTLLAVLAICAPAGAQPRPPPAGHMVLTPTCRNPAAARRSGISAPLSAWDTQILTRHAVAVLATYEYSPELTIAGQWLQNPTDGSGIVVPSATWTLSDRWSAVLSGYLPFGAEPVGLMLHSQYGASPLAYSRRSARTGEKKSPHQSPSVRVEPSFVA